MSKLYELKFDSLWRAFRGQGGIFWLASFYLFLEYVRPQSIYPWLQIIPWAQITIIIMGMRFLVENKEPIVSSVANKLLVAFVLVVIASSYFAIWPEESWADIDVMLSWFVIYFLLVNIINTEERFILFFVFFLLFSFKMSQHGFRTWMGRGFSFAGWGASGAPGWFQNSGEFGVQMCIFVPMAFTFYLGLRKNWGRIKKAFFLILPITGVGAIIASSSRGAVLGFAAVCLSFAINTKQRFRSLILVVIVLVGGILVAPQGFIDRFETIGTDVTSRQRIAYWHAGRDVISEYPWLGVGYSNWQTYYLTNIYEFETAGELHRAEKIHNIFLQLGTELGYVGLTIYLLMIMSAFNINRATRRVAARAGNNFYHWISIGLDSALVGYLVSGLFLSIVYYPFFWINLVFVVSLNNIAKQEDKKKNVDQQTKPKQQYEI